MDTVKIEFASADFKRETVNGSSVRRMGKIFEAGDYPDKNFSLTEEDAVKAVKNFRPVKVNLSHTQTVLDGKLGELSDVMLHSDGKTISGTADLPKWFDDLLDDDSRKVSCEWDRQEKVLVGIAVTPNPRVNDAVLMATFAEHQTSAGQYAIQEAHDMLARKGAICKANFVSKSESKAIQKAHDALVEAGAVCDDLTKNKHPYSYYDDGGGGNNEGDTLPKETFEMPIELNEEEQGAFKKFLAFFGQGDHSPKEKEAPKTEEKPEDPQVKFYREQFEAGLASRAESFAEGLVKAGKILAADKPKYAAMHRDAARQDATETAKFSDADGEKSFSRVALLEETASALPAKQGAANFTRETTDEEGRVRQGEGRTIVLFDGTGDIESSGDRAAQRAKKNAGLEK